MKRKFVVTVKAVWDDEADVWVATSEDVPGLILEAPDTDQLEKEIKLHIPQLLTLNDGDHKPREIPIRLYQESEFMATAIA